MFANIRRADLKTIKLVDRHLYNHKRTHGMCYDVQLGAILNIKSNSGRGGQSGKSIQSLSMDFRFNLLRNVKKVSWKKNQPWYREVRNGLNWFGYCFN